MPRWPLCPIHELSVIELVDLTGQPLVLYGLAAAAIAVALALPRALHRRRARTLTGVNALVHAANRLRDGDLTARVGPEASEGQIRPVALAFDEMAAALEERETAKSRAETGRQRSELERTIAELKRSNDELQQFAYVVSHDLQEPLRMVTSYTQLLAKRYKGKLAPDADEFIAFAVEGAHTMQRLISDLLAYSRVGRQETVLESADLGSVLSQAVANLKVSIEESQALVTSDPLPTIQGDRSQFLQLLQNLIGNAIRFHGSDPPRVHVAAEHRGEDWLFSVHDNGIGIDPQYSERVFIVFQRLHTKAESPGTGIGLAICKKIVERHGGRIWVESRPGQGATFFFTLGAQQPLEA